ncbi:MULTISPECIES: hypothetical protein [Methylorubrum]|uniref:hypothetical protein n=1 Tax=Methylorubrum TaxID=2282523 RepID=UPI00209F795E|nr:MULTISPECIES: hypothetical protein [Methylorubrum]MCP1550707.1 hypothetical protein [Methylorubrum zatmanii]MCP1552680.1 hypothetical protein [Methylorubrum extorquens]MCP1581010.1 hypothetical protein [Methylorubrum extorquens]
MSFLDDLPEILADALGDDFREATLIRSAAADGDSPWNPGVPSEQRYPCRAIHDEWGASYRSGGLVTGKDWKILVLAATLGVEPVEGDRIVLEGITLTVVSEGGSQPAVTSDPANATWVLRCRA